MHFSSAKCQKENVNKPCALKCLGKGKEEKRIILEFTHLCIHMHLTKSFNHAGELQICREMVSMEDHGARDLAPQFASYSLRVVACLECLGSWVIYSIVHTMKLLSFSYLSHRQLKDEEVNYSCNFPPSRSLTEERFFLINTIQRGGNMILSKREKAVFSYFNVSTPLIDGSMSQDKIGTLEFLNLLNVLNECVFIQHIDQLHFH